MAYAYRNRLPIGSLSSDDDVQVSAGEGHVAVARGSSHLSQGALSSQGVRDEGMPPVVDRKRPYALSAQGFAGRQESPPERMAPARE
jgi:hypothetical protein